MRTYKQRLAEYETEIRARASQAEYFKADGVTDPAELAARAWLAARYKPGPPPSPPEPPTPSLNVSDVGDLDHCRKDADEKYLWRVEDPEAGYDCRAAIVVIAATAEEAQGYFGMSDDDGDIFVTRVGVALPGAKSGLIVCEDFIPG